MKRIRQGFDLLRQSWSVLRSDPEMIAVAVVGMALSIGAFATFYLFDLVPNPNGGRDPRDILAWLPFLFVSTVIGNFTTAAMVGGACIRLNGGDPTVGDALRIATRNLPKLLGWSLFAVFVGALLRLLSERLPFAGRLVTILGGLAFQLAAILVVPVLLFEEKSITGSLRRSADLFKERWGESATAMGGIGLATLVALLPVVLAGSILMVASPVAGIAVIALGFIAMLGASASLNGVFTAVLYRYATQGDAPAGFSESALQGSFPPSKTKKKIKGFFKRS